MANLVSRGQQRDKPFRDALRMEIAAAQGADDKRSLRRIARCLLTAAGNGDVQAIREVADRIDGKVAQAVVGGDEDDAPLRIEQTIRNIVDPNNTVPDSQGLQAAADGDKV